MRNGYITLKTSLVMW